MACANVTLEMDCVMNMITNEKLAEELEIPEAVTDSYAAAVTSATRATAGSFRVKNILIPTRPSKASGDSLKYAAWLAGQFGCPITILHAPPAGSPVVSLAELQSNISRDTGVGGNQIRAILIRPGVTDFLPVTKAVREEHADLIVIASDFFKQPARFWQNDMMDKLMRHAHCPLLIVGEKSLQPVSD